MSDSPLDPLSTDPTTEGPADGGADTSSHDGADGGAGTEGPADGGADTSSHDGGADGGAGADPSNAI
jgi:hypothetical protein